MTDTKKNKYGRSLRVTCYGSSSSKTPEAYIEASRELGRALAEGNHICVNGGGKTGCMSGMTDGAINAGGKVVGVIHEMFLAGRAECAEDGAHASLLEIVVTGGPDLQERKKKLVEGCDAIVVMPGGPGTWDELWEMACSKNIGLVSVPIVVVNTDGFYDNFKHMLKRADSDELLYRKPEELVHFEDTSEGAVRWIEDEVARGSVTKSIFRGINQNSSAISSALHKIKKSNNAIQNSKWVDRICIFGAGLVVGISIASRVGIRK